MPEVTAPDATSGSGATPDDADKGDKGGSTNPPAGSSDGLGDAGQRALKSEREARAAAERERDDLSKRLKAIEEKDLPEAEKTKRRVAELEGKEATWDAERRALRVETSATSTATRLGFRDPDDALGWLALNKSKVDFDSDGKPTNVETLLKDLLKNKPHLASGTARPSGGADQGARGGATSQDMNARIRAAAGRRA